MKAILALITAAVGAFVIWFKWYTSSERTKLREFKDNEDERLKFIHSCYDGKFDAARELWKERVRKNRATR